MTNCISKDLQILTIWEAILKSSTLQTNRERLMNTHIGLQENFKRQQQRKKTEEFQAVRPDNQHKPFFH